MAGEEGQTAVDFALRLKCPARGGLVTHVADQARVLWIGLGNDDPNLRLGRSGRRARRFAWKPLQAHAVPGQLVADERHRRGVSVEHGTPDHRRNPLAAFPLAGIEVGALRVGSDAPPAPFIIRLALIQAYQRRKDVVTHLGSAGSV